MNISITEPVKMQQSTLPEVALVSNIMLLTKATSDNVHEFHGSDPNQFNLDFKGGSNISRGVPLFLKYQVGLGVQIFQNIWTGGRGVQICCDKSHSRLQSRPSIL